MDYILEQFGAGGFHLFAAQAKETYIAIQRLSIFFDIYLLGYDSTQAFFVYYGRLLYVIQRYIGVRLKHPYLAHRIGCNTAGSYVTYSAVLKGNARVCY